jgi:two-component system response regulator YesN
MFKVVIIDDETLVRVGLKSLINWEEHGFELAGEGENGQDGLELIISSKPDLVITDIKMPIMDGLEMIKKAFEVNKRLKFIVLSSYNEFNLVKEAMKLGAEDYLLKLEMKPDVLIEVLLQLRDKMLNELDEKDERKNAKSQSRASKTALREEFFKNIIGKMIPDSRYIEESVKQLEIELNEEELTCAVVKANLSDISHKYNEEDMRLLDFTIINIIEEICNEFFKSYVFKWNYGVYAIAFSKDRDMAPGTYTEKINGMCEILIQMLKQYADIHVSVGISGLHPGLADFRQAFSEANKIVGQTFFSGYGNILHYSSNSREDMKLYDIDLHQFKDGLTKAIDTLDADRVRAIFSDMLECLNARTVLKQSAYDICCQIAYFLDTVLGHEWISFKEREGLGRNSFESIKKLETLDEIIKYVRDLGNGICSFFMQKKQDTTYYLISKAKKYILENYGEYISLKKVAASLNISPGYLSSIFTQYTGMCFIDYVTAVKISMAKKLLKETDNKIYEISYMLGYENATYFSKIFKKTTGYTPKEFLQTFKED